MANTRSGGAPRDGAAGETASAAAASGSTTSSSSSSRKASLIAKPNPTSSSPNARETRSSATRESTHNTPAPNLRRSTRETKGKKKSHVPTPTPSTTPSQRSSREKKPKGAGDLPGNTGSTRKSTRVKTTGVSSSPAPKDSSRSPTPMPTPEIPAKRQVHVQNSNKDNHDDTETGSRPLKKQKRLDTKSYIAFFKTTEEQAKSPVLASPLREDDKNASMMQAEDNGAVLVYEESDAHDQGHGELSSVAANKILGDHSSDSHEMPEVILKRDELKIGSHCSDLNSESHMPIEMCLLNKAAESIPMIEAEEQAADSSNQNSLPELLKRPCSTAHHEEANKAIEDGGSIRIQGACTSMQTEAIQCDETDYNGYICVGCKSRKISDILKSCDGKGCKRHYHLSCMDPPLECVSPGIWLCIICTKKRIQFGVYSVSEGIESLWDVKEDNKVEAGMG